MEKIRIISVAPYEGLKNIIEEIASTREDCIVSSVVGDLEDGVALFSEINQDDYDVVISRGGTAELLAKVSKLPVVNLNFSYMDILSAMNLAKPYDGMNAFIGYPSLTETAERLTKLLDVPFDIFTVRNIDEVYKVMSSVKDKNYSLIITDSISSKVSQEVGINSILLISGRESVLKAINDAVSIGTARLEIRAQVELLEEAMALSHNSVIIFNENSELLYKSSNLKDTNSVIRLATSMIPSLLKKKRIHSVRKVNGKNKFIEGVKTESGKLIFYCDVHDKSYDIQGSGIEKTGIDDVNRNLINIIFNQKYLEELKSNLSGLSMFKLPVLISGETGTGKDTVANALFINSSFSDAPYYKFYCKEMDDKAWVYTLGGFQSPLNSSGLTLYFNSVDELSPLRLRELISYFKESPCLKDNHVILTWNSENTEAANLLKVLKEELSLAEIKLGPLRDNRDEIPRLVSLYIDQINRETGHQTSGIDKEGLELLMEYPWPGNHTELRNVLMSLTSRSMTTFVPYDTVKNVLEKSRYTTDKKTIKTESEIDLSQPLDDIIYDIVNLKLNESQISQTDLANELGISRTTLWRILKSGKSNQNVSDIL